MPTTSQRGAESEVAHKWARWLHNPCRLGGPHRSQRGAESEVAHKWAGGYIALVGCGIPTASQRGQNEKWPTSGLGGYIATAACGMPTTSQRGAESEVAHKWAGWLHNPCGLWDPQRFRAGGQNRKWPTSGPVGSLTPAALGVPTAHSGGQNEKWPTSGPGGYITPAACGIPNASERGAESEVAHKWARWLHNPCRLWDPHRFRAGGRIRSGPQVGQVAP